MSPYPSGAPPKENPGGRAGVSKEHTQQDERQHHSGPVNAGQEGHAPFHLYDFVARFRVGRFACALSFCGGRVLCEWDPMPRQLSRAEIAEYRASRNAAIAQLAHERGLRIAVIDL